MKATTIWTIIVALLICINSLVLIFIWQQNRLSPPTDGNVEVKDYIIKELSLSKRQVEKFEVMRKAHHASVEKINEHIHLLRDSLFTNINTVKVGATVIDSLTNKIGYNTALTDKITFYHFRDLRAILEPAQQEKFDSIIHRVLQMMVQPMPPGGRGPNGMPPPPDHPEGMPMGPGPTGDRPPGQ
jgi:periplasmic protein CpxP/Spy